MFLIRGVFGFTTSYPSVELPERITVVPSYVLVSYNYSVLFPVHDCGAKIMGVPIRSRWQPSSSRPFALDESQLTLCLLAAGRCAVTPREHEAGVHQSSGAQAALLIGARTPNHHHHAHIPPTATSAMPLSVCLSIYLSTSLPLPTYTATPSPHNPLRVKLLRIDLIRGRCGHQSWMARQSGSTP